MILIQISPMGQIYNIGLALDHQIFQKSNNINLGGEMFSLDLLKRLDELCTQSQDREHVCSYIWEHPNDYYIHAFKAPKEIAFPDIKLDVNTQEDFARLTALCSELNWDCTALDIASSYNDRFGYQL